MQGLSLFVAFCAVGYVSAHGFLCTVTINDRVYNGNNPNATQTDFASIIRKINHTNPNRGASNSALNCGPGASAASEVADVNPGNFMTFTWRQANYSNWPHDLGPVMTYMTSCGSLSCDKFDTTNAKWFKIRQVGRKDGSAQWAQKDISEGRADNVTIPSTLAPGNYILRHEMIALQFALDQGSDKGPEFYPACVQLRVGGNQIGRPQENDLVSLPGAYHDDDQGLLYDATTEAYMRNPTVEYKFPGPDIAAFVTDTPAFCHVEKVESRSFSFFPIPFSIWILIFCFSLLASI